MESVETSGQNQSAYRRGLKYAVALLFLALVIVVFYPFMSSLSPSAHIKDPNFTRIDISGLEPGEAIVRSWDGLPVVVLRRTTEQIEHIATLKPHREHATLTTVVPDPAGVIEDIRSLNKEYFVAYSWSGHKNQCSAQYSGSEEVHVFAKYEWVGGFFEACRGAWYDTAGHVLKGSWREGSDLSIPPHRYIDQAVIEIGPVPSDPNQSLKLGRRESRGAP